MRGEVVLKLKSDDFENDPKIQSEYKYTLQDIFDNEKYGGNIEIIYEYDFGDDWIHDITFFGRADPSLRKTLRLSDDTEAFCLGGEGHPCAEDCGSDGGWEDLKSLLNSRKKDPEGLREWYRDTCLNGHGGAFDPYKWNMNEVIWDL